MKAVLALLLGLITCTLTLSHATDPAEPHTIDPLQIITIIQDHATSTPTSIPATLVAFITLTPAAPTSIPPTTTSIPPKPKYRRCMVLDLLVVMNQHHASY
eukprot:220511_1